MKTNLYALVLEREETLLERKQHELHLTHVIVQAVLACAIIVFGVLVWF